MSDDGRLGGEPHDVLAAEEFPFPAGADVVSPLRLPDDPTGIAEPHDVLAAEDFAMPAGPDRRERGPARRALPPAALLAAGLLVAWLVRRR